MNADKTKFLAILSFDRDKKPATKAEMASEATSNGSILDFFHKLMLLALV